LDHPTESRQVRVDDFIRASKKNLGSTGIRDRARSQTTLDLRITTRLALTARCAAYRMRQLIDAHEKREQASPYTVNV
jgi:hypothetical protein